MKQVNRRTFIGIGAGVAATASLPSAMADTTSSGYLAPVGGALEEDNQVLYDELIDLAGDEDAHLAVVPTANADPEDSISYWTGMFADYGIPSGQTTGIEISPLIEDWQGNADDEDIATTITDSTIVWFSGGNQSRIIDEFIRDDGSPTLALEAVQAVLTKGGVVGGSSAGAAMMSDPMISGGTSIDAMTSGIGDGVSLSDGLGLLEEGIVDQHFDQRGRFGRLLRACWGDSSAGYSRQPYGFGIDENTGFIFDLGREEATVVGEHGVMVIDTTDATGGDSDPIEIENVRLHHLTHGDTVDVNTGDVTPAEGKTVDTVADPFYDGSSDSREVFAPGEIPDYLMSTGLVDNTEDSVMGAAMGAPAEDYRTEIQLQFNQDEQTRGYWGRYYEADSVGRYAAINVALSTEFAVFRRIGGNQIPPGQGGDNPGVSTDNVPPGRSGEHPGRGKAKGRVNNV
jgi:cyanophycinase